MEAGARDNLRTHGLRQTGGKQKGALWAPFDFMEGGA